MNYILDIRYSGESFNGMSKNKKSPRRRDILRASAGASLLGITGLTASNATAQEETTTETSTEDEHDGFEVRILGEPAPFVDDVAARFELTFADAETAQEETPTETATEDDGPIVIDMEDASNVIVAEATWTEGARSGWHQHPGMSIVHMVEGEIEYTRADDCVSRTYAEGDAWIDPGAVHTADSETGARAYVMFLGIPEGEPATESIAPEDVDC